MLSHLFESTTTPIITKIIKFCYLTFLAAGRWRDRLACKRRLAIALLESVAKCDAWDCRWAIACRFATIQ